MWYLPLGVTEEALLFSLFHLHVLLQREQFALIPPSAKQTWLLLLRSTLFAAGCACNAQTPSASLYQQSLRTKTTPKHKHIPFPSKTASGAVNVTADAERAPLAGLSGLCDFWGLLTSPYRKEFITIISMHHWHGHCIHIALLIFMGPIHHMIWQQRGHHQHLPNIKLSYLYKVILIVPDGGFLHSLGNK